jgi:tubulin polyglutamylase TTLL2
MVQDSSKELTMIICTLHVIRLWASGYKWDLRLYVVVTCRNPLTVYAYTEGIVRFATNKYNLDDLSDIYSHLTNTSLNKASPAYKKNKATIGIGRLIKIGQECLFPGYRHDNVNINYNFGLQGSKWTLQRLRAYLKSQGVNDFHLWQKIWSILVLTIIGQGKSMAFSDGSKNCNTFEFLGFDVLVDDKLRPHLLEVSLDFI